MLNVRVGPRDGFGRRRNGREALRIYGAFLILLGVTTASALGTLNRGLAAWLDGAPLERICRGR